MPHVPELSVVVPFHNVQSYAEDTLRSLAGNAAEHIEFVLVDDCSSDATPEILERWRERLPHCTVIRHARNGGIARARNSGIDAARGTYLTFLDGDDWYGPGHLAALLAALQRYDCDFVRTDHVRSTGVKREIRRAPAARRGRVLHPREAILPADSSTMVDYPFVWAGAYRRTLFAGGALRFPEQLRTAEDRLWTWRLHLAAESFAAVGLPGVFYRRGVSTSLTQIADERQLDFLPAHDLLLDDLAADPDRHRLLPKAVRTYCALIAFHAGNASRYGPDTARQFRLRAAGALQRMPPDVLDSTLASMDPGRSRTLRRLRGRRTMEG
jgi:glycosyltransferase involved in cell wall biosynthesis